MSRMPPTRSRRDVDTVLARGLAAALDGSAHATGAATAFVLTGEAGAGKSHALRAAVSGLSVPLRWAAADEAAVRHPYALAAGLLGVELGRPLPADAEQRLLARLDELCAGGPLVLAVDDAHQADAASLAVLNLVAAAARDLPLALLMARRPLPEREHLLRLLRRPDTGEITLPALDEIDLDALVHEYTGRWPGSALRSLLLRHPGNALYAITVIDDLRRSGALTEHGRLELLPGWRVGQGAAGGRSLEEVIESELAGLQGPAREVVRALSVMGAPTTLRHLAAVSGLEPVALVEPVQALLDRGVVTFGAGERLAFAHDSYREVVHHGIPAPLRRVLHAAAAEHADAADRAHHVIASGAPLDEVLRAVRAAGPDLVHAPAVEADLLARAAAAANSSTAGSAATELAVGRARALARSGQLRRAEESARGALASATGPSDRVELSRVLIFALTLRGEVPAALRLIDETLAGPVPARVRDILTDHRQQAAQLAGLAPLPLGPPVADPRTLTLTGLVCEAVRACLTGHPQVAIELAWEASRQHMSRDVDPYEGLSGDIWPPFIELSLGGPASATAALREVEGLREDRGASWQVPSHQLIGASIDLVAGRLADAAAAFDAALELVEPGEFAWTSLAVGARTMVDVLRGDLDAADRRLREWDAEPRVLQFGIPQPARARVALLEARRRHVEAARLARDVWATARAQHCHTWLAAVAPDLGRVALRAADDRLRVMIARDLALLPRPLSPAAIASVRLAEALTGPADHGLADRAATAAAHAARVGDALVETSAWEEAAVASAGQGDKEAARRYARRALELAEETGAVTVAVRVAGRLRSLGVRLGATAGRRRPTRGWDALTPTETLVAELVASGLPGPEVARRLHVSPRTVQTHVSHVLAKLGLSSRVELAAAGAARAAAVAAKGAGAG
ncbi:LuxR C-terminal-related transcriptional regulator [Kitasatospora sp. NBC_01287]|uniref:LuxR C-terminal-related transcriptional regulator n=1 Tax=Kitasatospora sp. NBC_01287 TaxID=2903573 RepID=UPI00225924C8|nr:LuxR family transcriptional regulator [Kitasatospora sp. NBC_01287]MCX4744630.1 LuxR C-terminal-related transcriptional regulator [Kitasatospora sp. NBC_01287]